ncbi:uncharacterized protein LOC143041627 [Oratosquilla oratoria]|uniref:uncharacterized protein LOC143041627 n=1 Tax=Oratosquilla oratoria TaxID=337810 RepID=UPI003F7685EB
MKCLEDVGVDRANELRLIKDIDLHAALKPIKARALMETWTAQVDDNPQVVSEASSPLRLIPRTPLRSIVPDSQSPSPSVHCATWPSTVELTFEDMEDRPKGVRKAVHRVLKQGGAAELSPRDRRAIVRHVVAKVLQMQPKPYRCHMEVIAKKVIDIFPCLKDVQVAGTSIGRGYDSVLNQLVARAETERRGQYKIKRIAEDSDSEEGARVMIMKGCSIFELRDKWPALFTAEALDGHFQQLMGFSCQGRMLEAFGEKQQLIVDSFEEESRKPSDVNRLTEEPDFPKTPCLIAVGTPCLYNGSNFYLASDGVIVMRDIPCFIQAFALMFELFFIIDVKYPSNAGFTLEFVQRFFMKIDPNSRTKIQKRPPQKKKVAPVSPKVLSLFNLLKHHQPDQPEHLRML